MNDCPTCGSPLTWSDDRSRVWCAVYGDHRALFADLVHLCAQDSDHTNAATWPRLRVVA